MKDLILNRNTWKKLIQWTELDRDREFPALHPDDEGRWLDFMIATFEDDVDAGAVANALPDWLVKEKGWQQEKANYMAKCYEYGIRVLKAYVVKKYGQ